MSNDMSAAIIAKSDQINAEDFLAGPATFQIESVSIKAGAEQPVSIKLVGEERVWRPCKTASRILVAGWKADANQYVGRSVTLYRDPTVKWGGLEVGGIRVSHMSHIDREMVIALQVTKGNKRPYVIKPLKIEATNKPTPKPANKPPESAGDGGDVINSAEAMLAALPNYTDPDKIRSDFGELQRALKSADSMLYETLKNACGARVGELQMGAIVQEGEG